MLTPILAHVGQPLAPHDLWAMWNPDPVVIVGLALAGWSYRSGWLAIPPHRRSGRRAVLFSLGLGTIGLALLSPIHALAGTLVSGHMIQHLLLMVVAAPLIILGDPGMIMRGLPVDLRKATGHLRRRLDLTPNRFRWSRHPVLVFLVYTGALWLWHASVLYETATGNEIAHGLEHGSFLLTALLFWAVVVPRRSAPRIAPGVAVMLIFAVTMQGVLLSALMTFADQPWYPSYAETSALWGIDPLDDQRIAGLIMWIPSGLIFTMAALASMVAWINGNRSGRSQRVETGSSSHSD